MSENYINCLTCPVAHRFIAEYSEYYKKYRGRPKSQEHDNSVRTLNSIILTPKKKETENQYCADNLKTIITIIKEFLDDCDNQMLEPKSFDVLLSVLLELQESEKAEDEENNSVTPQEWLDIVRKQINN